MRCALLCAPLLALWPWASLPGEQLWAGFCEVYRVPSTRVDDFVQRHAVQAHPHPLTLTLTLTLALA